MKQITIEAPEGYEFLIEDGKPAFREPKQGEWYFTIFHDALRAVEDHVNCLPMYILVPELTPEERGE